MLDLSLVTDRLCKLVTDAINTSPLFGGDPPKFGVKVSGQPPQTPSGGVDTELTVYLFHVAPDPHLANSFWSAAAQGGGVPPVAVEPLALDLWYLVSAQSATGYVNAQQLLGIAMKCLHDNGIFFFNTPTPPPGLVSPSQATITLESPGFDEISRLWQAFNLPLRTTAQYRVSVVFLSPENVPEPEPQVEQLTIQLHPNIALEPGDPELETVSRTGP